MKTVKSKPCLRSNYILIALLGLVALWASLPTARAETPIQAWVQRFSNTNGANYGGKKIVTDLDGNVLVAGYADREPARQDILIIKYSNSGDVLWTNRTLGADNTYYSSHGIGLTTDSDGKVFVAGAAAYGGVDDYVTMAFSAAGEGQWTRFYGEPSGRSDGANDIAVDADGNVVVSGFSFNSVTLVYDYVTIKYSGADIPLWTNRCSRSANRADAHLALDGNGNVFLAGYARNASSLDSWDDYVTVKYSSTGLQVWKKIYTGSDYYNDTATAIGLDMSTNVFVTGITELNPYSYFYATIKYSAAGQALWTNFYYGSSTVRPAMAIGSNGNVFVTGSAYGNFITIAYSNAGTQLWADAYNGPGNGNDAAYAVAVDADGNLFVTGSSSGSSSYSDYATVKYSSAGVGLWTNRYNGPANGEDIAVSLAVGPDGAVYVTGVSDGDSSTNRTYDFVTVKYISLPEIAAQPAARTHNAGTTVTFTVSASGSAPLRYQWQRSETNLFNAGNISGVNSNTLTLVDVQPEDAGSYRVIVTNAFGGVTSSVAVLTVVVPSLPIELSSAALSNGVFNFSFTNTPGANFTVLTTTNLSVPLSNWTVLGGFLETSPGQFQFTDPQPATNQQRFYCVRTP